jgi:chorismate--pyruvate lyase
MKQKQYHAGESVWRIGNQVINDTIPSQILCWLFDPASLTSRLVAACSKTFRVQVLEQTWRTPMHSELRRLGMPCRQTALIREVLLFCGETPWVFARTVIPQRTLTGKRKFLANLGTKPLGAVLFADPHMKRDEIEVARLSAGQPLYERAVQALSDVPPTIWGRRSVFYLQDKPLLVNEIFLPGIASCPRPTTKY